MKTNALLLSIVMPVIGAAQAPNVSARLDAHFQISGGPRENASIRSYDPYGKPSTFSVILNLEPGFNFFVSQRFQTIRRAADNEFLNEYYLEDPGYWRAGRHYLPFGRGRLLNEIGFGVSVNTFAGGNATPIVVSGVSDGGGKQEGITTRFGGRLGLSAAVGEHFGIGIESLTLLREVEDAPPPGRGYREVFGADYKFNMGKRTWQLEAGSFKRGHTVADRNMLVSDVSVQHTMGTTTFMSGWTREWNAAFDVYRFGASINAGNNLTWEPLLRFGPGELRDLSLTLRFRL